MKFWICNKMDDFSILFNPFTWVFFSSTYSTYTYNSRTSQNFEISAFKELNFALLQLGFSLFHLGTMHNLISNICQTDWSINLHYWIIQKSNENINFFKYKPSCLDDSWSIHDSIFPVNHCQSHWSVDHIADILDINVDFRIQIYFIINTVNT